MVVLGSNDGLNESARRIGGWEDLAKEVGRKNYTLACSRAEVRQVQLVVKPLAGARVYLGEVEIHGTPPSGDPAADAVRMRTVLHAAELDATHGPVLLSGTSDGMFTVLSIAGDQLLRKQLPDAVNSIWVDDVDGDGARDILVGCDDTRAYLLGANGQEKWAFDAPPTRHWRSYPGRAHVVRAMDLDGDGNLEVLVGTENFIYCLDKAGKELWKFAIPDHVTCIEPRSVKGKAGSEAVAGSQYSWWPALDERGRERYRRRSVMGMTLRSLLCPDFDADGTDEAVFGGEDGYVYYDFDGWTWPTGGAIVGLGRTMRSGRPSLVAASENGALYCFSPEGQLRFRQNFAVPLSALASTHQHIAVGTVTGHVYLLQSDGALLAGTQVGSEVQAIALLPDDLIVAATANGSLIALKR